MDFEPTFLEWFKVIAALQIFKSALGFWVAEFRAI